MKTKVLLIFNEAPIPFGGAAARWYNLVATELIRRNYDIALYATCKTEKDFLEAKKFFPAAHFYVQGKTTSSLFQKLKTIFRPFSYTISNEMFRDVNLLNLNQFDIVHIEQAFGAWALKSIPQHALVSIHYLATIDHSEAKFPTIKDYLITKLMMRTEKKLIGKFNFVKSCSLRIENQIKNWYPHKNFYHFPFGIDSSNYIFRDSPRGTNQKVILLVASMNWYPGKSSAIRLLLKIWPEVKKRNPDAILKIVGWVARDVLKEYLDVKDVFIYQDVPDVKQFFYESSLIVYAPSRGSGVKIKIQEAMLLGTPVVTTSEGVEGLNAINFEHALIAEDDQTLINYTDQLLNDESLQEKLRRNARKLIEVDCGQGKTIDQLELLYRDITNIKRD
jgi:glycosyltransferase involved in cell wall biosynthesis